MDTNWLNCSLNNCRCVGIGIQNRDRFVTQRVTLRKLLIAKNGDQIIQIALEGLGNII